jgi:hypothetical protein
MQPSLSTDPDHIITERINESAAHMAEAANIVQLVSPEGAVYVTCHAALLWTLRDVGRVNVEPYSELSLVDMGVVSVVAEPVPVRVCWRAVARSLAFVIVLERTST